MALHNTEELKAGPTSQLESEALNDQNQTYEFPLTSRIRKPSTKPSTISSSSTATRGKTWLPSAPPGSNPKSCSSWKSLPTKI